MKHLLLPTIILFIACSCFGQRSLSFSGPSWKVYLERVSQCRCAGHPEFTATAHFENGDSAEIELIFYKKDTAQFPSWTDWRKDPSLWFPGNGEYFTVFKSDDPVTGAKPEHQNEKEWYAMSNGRWIRYIIWKINNKSPFDDELKNKK